MNIFQAANCGAYTTALDEATQRWGIVMHDDLARFLAQVSVESAGFTRVVESLNYRPERLLAVLNGRNGITTLAQAVDIVQQGPQAIGEALYGGEWGAKRLGNRTKGDGYVYRGRGLIQLTGRDNYVAATKGCGVDFVSTPEAVAVAKYAADVACWFWMSRHLNGVTDVVAVTKAINGGTNALAERQALTIKLLAAL
jgi:putative chitinase